MGDTGQVRSGVADRLKLAREHAGLSQLQVSKLMKIHRPSVSEIEAGRRKVSAEELTALARIYGVSVSWLTRAESEVSDPAVELAARELSKINKQDLDKVLQLLRTLRRRERTPND